MSRIAPAEVQRIHLSELCKLAQHSKSVLKCADLLLRAGLGRPCLPMTCASLHAYKVAILHQRISPCCSALMPKQHQVCRKRRNGRKCWLNKATGSKQQRLFTIKMSNQATLGAAYLLLNSLMSCMGHKGHAQQPMLAETQRVKACWQTSQMPSFLLTHTRCSLLR